MIVAVYMVAICVAYTVLALVSRDAASVLTIPFVGALLAPGLLGWCRGA